jgi:hypothetical protein
MNSDPSSHAFCPAARTLQRRVRPRLLPLFKWVRFGYVLTTCHRLPTCMSAISSILQQGRSPWGRLRIVSVSSWFVLSSLSMIVALWMAGPSNVLGAEVRVSRGSEGGVYVNVRNYGSRPWEQVLIDFDNRYFLRTDSVAMGVELNIAMENTVSRWAIPRTPGIFNWEGRGHVERFPGFEADRTYSPRLVTVSSEQGTVEFPFEPSAD